MMNRNKLALLVVMIMGLAINSCKNITERAETITISGYRVAISAVFGGNALPADELSQAMIRVEVWDAAGDRANNIPVALTATLGTLASSSLTIWNGVALTTFTSGTTPGTASVTATVENVDVTITFLLF